MVELPQETWRSLMENAPNIILIVNRDGTIEYINHVVPGMNVEEVIGKNQYEFIEPEHRDLVRQTIEDVFNDGKPRSYEIKGTGVNTGTAWYSTSVGPIRSNGEIVSVSLFTTDVTDRKQAEESLRQAKDELIAQQSKAIMELSTPVIQVWDDILVLPLIGTIDTARAQQIIENLLSKIVETQAAVAIMDITGVAVVDTKVANHLITTIEAAKMLGTEVVLTGVSPHNAQTLVKLGVNLAKITTKGSLQAGLKQAMQVTRHEVVKQS